MRFNKESSRLSLHAKAEISPDFIGYENNSDKNITHKDDSGVFQLSNYFDGGVACGSLFYDSFRFSSERLPENKQTVSLKEEEINFFYNKNNSNHNYKAPPEKVIDESNDTKPACSMHLVACDSQSNLVVIGLCKMEVLFLSDSLSSGHHSVQPYLKASASNRNQTNKKYVKEIIIQRVRKKYQKNILYILFKHL